MNVPQAEGVTLNRDLYITARVNLSEYRTTRLVAAADRRTISELIRVLVERRAAELAKEGAQ